MGRLVYSAIASLDLLIEDAQGRFDWSQPDAEVHTVINADVRRFGTHIYGRRLYETMAVWEDDGFLAGAPAEVTEFAAIWRAVDKLVLSRTLTAVATSRTRILGAYDPAELRRIVREAADDVLIGGAEVAGLALRDGIVDEIVLYLAPTVLGGGKRALPQGLGARLSLADVRRFSGGMVRLAYHLAGR